jgi:hypothetical protein
MVRAGGRIHVAVVSAFMMVAAAALQGCGKSGATRDGGTTDASLDGGPPNPGGPLPLTELCAAVTADICAYGLQCAGWEYRDHAHCVAEVACPGVMDLSSSVASGAVTYDPVEAGKCQARFQGDPCNFAPFLFVPTVFEILRHCPGTLTPGRGAGGACVATEECTAGLYCKKEQVLTQPVCPGQCTPLPQAGQPCVNAPCAPGLYCQAQVCRPYAHAMDACATVGECYAGPAATTRLWCDMSTHTCEPPAGEGERCGIETPGGNASLQIYCATGLWCDALFIDRNGVCREPGGAGSPCSYDVGACTTGFHCVGYSPNVTLGTCAGPAASGSECSLDTDCMPDLRCVAGVCAAPSPLGGACSQTSDCQQGLACDTAVDFVCRQPRYPGDACGDPDGFCLKSICREGRCVDLGKIGEPCVSGDCQLGLGCPGGICRDNSLCRAM